MPIPVPVVIGMHRSGTSMCANLLHVMGADMGDENFNVSPANARGHWERPDLVGTNDNVFVTFRRQWALPSHILSLPEGWLAHARVQELRRAAANNLRPRLATGRLFGFKDPRTTLLLPFWNQVFADIGAEPRYVLCIRNPAQVVRSLAMRDNMARGQAEYRWLHYNIEAIKGIGGDPICIVPYEHWFTDAAGLGARLAAHTGLPPASLDALHSVITADLRHDDTQIAPAAALAARLHHLLELNSPRTTLDLEVRKYATHVSDFADLVQPLLIDMEILRTSVSEQRRVITDLGNLVKKLRAELGQPT